MMYTIPELPELTGTDAQVSYANDIRAGRVRAILGVLPDGTPNTGAAFRDRVIESLARYLSPSRDEIARVAALPNIDEVIQETITVLLSAKQAKSVIESSKKGTIAERVAAGAARRLGWTE